MGRWQFIGGKRMGFGTLEPNDVLVVTVNEMRDAVIPLQEEDIIWPGFVDVHMHLRADGTHGPGVDPVVPHSMGSMGVADAGSYGWSDIPPSLLMGPMPIRLWVALLPEGLSQHPFAPPYKGVTDAHLDQARQVMNVWHKSIVGIKIRLGQHDVNEDERLLVDGAKLSRTLGIRLMVHVTNSYLPFDAIQAALDSGDVVTHIFHGRRGTIVQNGKLDPSVHVARRRGILLDVGHGANHFAWRVFRECLAQGVLPDTISTDMTQATCGKPPVVNLPYLCSKLIAAGMSWSHVYHAVVKTPARILKIPQPSGVVILKAYQGPSAFVDSEGVVVWGRQYLQPEVVIDGHRVIRNNLA